MFFIVSSFAATAGFGAGLAAGGTLFAGAAGARKLCKCRCMRGREGR